MTVHTDDRGPRRRRTTRPATRAGAPATTPGPATPPRPSRADAHLGDHLRARGRSGTSAWRSPRPRRRLCRRSGTASPATRPRSAMAAGASARLVLRIPLASPPASSWTGALRAPTHSPSGGSGRRRSSRRAERSVERHAAGTRPTDEHAPAAASDHCAALHDDAASNSMLTAVGATPARIAPTTPPRARVLPRDAPGSCRPPGRGRTWRRRPGARQAAPQGDHLRPVQELLDQLGAGHAGRDSASTSTCWRARMRAASLGDLRRVV